MGVSSALSHEASVTEESGKQERLGGARADFVANLGRRRTELAAILEVLREDPKASRERDELRRRLHALGAGAKLLRFTRLSDEIKQLEELLADAAVRGEVTADDADLVEDLLSRAAELAWGQTTATKRTAPPSAVELRDGTPALQRSLVSVLVLGPRYLGEALGREDEVPVGANVFEVEQTLDLEGAVDLAKVVAPDLVVIDADLPNAADVIEGLLDDPLTESTPIIAVGRFQKQDDAARMAALGVAKALLKPLSPNELRRVANQVLSSYVKREVVREPFGSIPLRELASRLAEELQRGIADAAMQNGQTAVDYGEGNELSAAVWGAVARIRDVVTIKSRGAIRFSLGGPEGAMPVSWLSTPDTASTDRMPSGRVRSSADVSLEGTTIIVADDDPATIWFLAGVLKTAGAKVYEARDGERALEIAKHRDPDMIITDILMPKLDGFGLCRAIKRDVLLRDVPVIMLSWKEDLLQRMRELGADADGYMRKEASAGAFVQRVRELLRQKKRVTDRVAGGGQVRGRLDGLTSYSLLRMACKTRRDTTMSIRDATFLYEVDVRDGRPVRATRTTSQGRFERGPTVLAALLGTGDGRFVVSPPGDDEASTPLKADLSGTLSEQLMPVVATARAAQSLLAGSNLVRALKIGFDEDLLASYMESTPPPMRSILIELANGTSPRTLISRGKESAHLVESLLREAANQGVICEVYDAEGVDRLPQAIGREISLLRGERKSEPVGTVSLMPHLDHTPLPAPPLEIQMPNPSEVLARALEPRPQSTADAGVETADAIDGAVVLPALPEEIDEPSPAYASNLDDPWFFEASDKNELSPPPDSGPRMTPPPRPAQEIASRVLEASPAPTPPPKNTAIELRAPTPRPDATRTPRPEARLATPTPTPSKLPTPPGLVPMLTLGSLHPPPVATDEPTREHGATKSARREKTPTPTPANTRKQRAERELTPPSPYVDRRKVPLPSSYYQPVPPPKKDRKVLLWIAFAACGVAFALWARWSRERSIVSEDVLKSDRPVAAEVAAAGATPALPTDTASPAGDATPPKPRDTDEPEILPLRDSEKLKKGQGMLEVVAGKSDTIFIDGKAMGSGPVVSVALKAKDEPYEIKVRLRDEDRVRRVAVKEGKLTRVRVAAPWSR